MGDQYQLPENPFHEYFSSPSQKSAFFQMHVQVTHSIVPSIFNIKCIKTKKQNVFA